MPPSSPTPLDRGIPVNDESKLRIDFLYSVFLLAGVVASVMGFVRWQTSALMGVIDFVFAGLNFSLLFYLSRHKQKIEQVSTVALVLCFVLFLAIYLLATDNSMRLSLFFLLAASAFFLKGRNTGRAWLAVIILSIVLVHLSGRFATGYATLDIATTCIYLIALFFIFENYESFKEKERERKQSEESALRAKAEAEAENLAKSQFLATMSHEIRTPLNGILGMAQLMQSGPLSEQEQREHATVILNSGQTLLALLNDILDFSKIEAGKTTLVPVAFSAAQIVEETASLFAKTAAAKGLRIEAIWHGPADRHYLADASRLRQMLANLTNNAIKFTSSGEVRIEARELGHTAADCLLEFAITDSGIGIPTEKLPLLFQPFSQLDSSTTRDYGGSGLGLSIVRNLATQMGGDAGVESEPGRGSRFWFSIRADFQAQAEAGRQAGYDRFATACELTDVLGTILVVEDNPVNRKVVLALLDKIGVRATSVENGQQAVDAVTGGLRPKAILMDCQMPVMDGLEATTRIRQWEIASDQPRLPIIALTAGAFEEDRQRCLAAGMDDFLTKPLSLAELQKTLIRWMSAPAAAQQ
jgi:signal transduction histidine kinase